MRHTVEFIVRELVDSPEEVNVVEIPSDESVTYEVRVAPDDLGKVIGKQGRIANAIRTIDGLPHANLRPSAWWFPLADPSGAWFDRVAESAQLYLEPLAPHRTSPPAPSSAAEDGLT